MEEPEIRIEVRKVPLLDTGLGKEAGYANDAELVAAAAAQRAALPQAEREVLDEVDRRVTKAFLFGIGS